MNKEKFFDSIRDDFRLTNGNVAGFDFLLDYGQSLLTPLDELAYILATAWWETAQTMEPIAEFGKGKGKAYGKKHPVTGHIYYGRGYVQLTWYENYLNAGTILGVDLVNNPDLAMDRDIAVRILFVGMSKGWFTGKKLSDYIDNIDEEYKEDLREFSNARRIVNGTDKQVIIGQIAWSFKQALKAAGYREVQSTKTVAETPPAPVIVPEKPIVEAMEIVLRSEDLDKVTLKQFLEALNTLNKQGGTDVR